MATLASSSSGKGQQARMPEQQAAQKFQTLRSEMQGIATKLGELETDAEEHGAVIETLRETVKKTPDRKCFRMIGGILAERTVKDVLPALEQNVVGLRKVMEELAKQYKSKDDELQALQREHAQ